MDRERYARQMDERDGVKERMWYSIMVGLREEGLGMGREGRGRQRVRRQMEVE